jgi:hypothetical protein
MTSQNLEVICWNARGLNSPARCITVHKMMTETFCHLACFQETKLASIDGVMASFLGGYKHNCFTHKPTEGSRGGILLLWNDHHVELQNIAICRFSLTATAILKECGTTFLITAVYGPA